jgi:hypothetical protein
MDNMNDSTLYNIRNAVLMTPLDNSLEDTWKEERKREREKKSN